MSVKTMFSNKLTKDDVFILLEDDTRKLLHALEDRCYSDSMLTIVSDDVCGISVTAQIKRPNGTDFATCISTWGQDVHALSLGYMVLIESLEQELSKVKFYGSGPQP